MILYMQLDYTKSNQNIKSTKGKLIMKEFDFDIDKMFKMSMNNDETVDKNIYGILNKDIEGDMDKDIYGVMAGDINGDMNGDIRGVMTGDINGNMHGKIYGKMLGDVHGKNLS